MHVNKRDLILYITFKFDRYNNNALVPSGKTVKNTLNTTTTIMIGNDRQFQYLIALMHNKWQNDEKFMKKVFACFIILTFTTSMVWYKKKTLNLN